MSKTGRNDPCPCGSGKKFKRCCMKATQVTPAQEEPSPTSYAQGAFVIVDDFEDDLDDRSNEIVDLINDGHLDEAEAKCHQLLNDHPDQVDGLDRLGMVYEARGQGDKAAEYYKRAADFIRAKGNLDERADWFLEQAERVSS